MPSRKAPSKFACDSSLFKPEPPTGPTAQQARVQRALLTTALFTLHAQPGIAHEASQRVANLC
jgi:hypothetical protein